MGLPSAAIFGPLYLCLEIDSDLMLIRVCGRCVYLCAGFSPVRSFAVVRPSACAVDLVCRRTHPSSRSPMSSTTDHALFGGADEPVTQPTYNFAPPVAAARKQPAPARPSSALPSTLPAPKKGHIAALLCLAYGAQHFRVPVAPAVLFGAAVVGLALLGLHSLASVNPRSSRSSGGGASGSSNGAFVATHEWQVVREGQSIPPGLHIKMDMKTGLKMAKLL